jgi:protein disulfide-isomerase
MFPRYTLALALCLMVPGCSKHSATPASASGAVSPASSKSSTSATSSSSAIVAGPAAIAWYGGSVESAFATARTQNKPVFLYWGAKWCPPCHELKATVFSRPDFIEKLTLFIPVYLDGDDPGAQKWGDKFGVSG